MRISIMPALRPLDTPSSTWQEELMRSIRRMVENVTFLGVHKDETTQQVGFPFTTMGNVMAAIPSLEILGEIRELLGEEYLVSVDRNFPREND